MSTAQIARRSLWVMVAWILVVTLLLGLPVLGDAVGQTASPLVTVGVDVASADVSQVTYRVVATNHGSAAASSVRLTDVVPANTTFERSDPAPSTPSTSTPGSVSCTNDGTREAAGTVCEWDLGELAPSQAKVVLITFNIAQDDAASFSVANKAEVSAGSVTNDDTDSSLQRHRTDVTHDTFVAEAEPANTNHGSCSYLRISQEGGSSGFLKTDALPAEKEIEQLWGAQLRARVSATTYSSTERGSLALHRLTSPWSQGTGSCEGAPGADDEARTGTIPASEAVATATAEVSAQPEILNWNVTSDLVSASARADQHGWKIDDATIGTGAGYTEIHSSSNQEAKPRLFLVYTTPEAPTCIDADPESQTGFATGEPSISAAVTDGKKVIDAPSGIDACDGAPVRSQIDWKVETDTPDVYISRQNGTEITKVMSRGSAGPDSLTTASNDAGVSTVGVRLSDPSSASTTASTRVSAAINGAPEVKERDDPDPLCAIPQNPPACPGEGATEDDVDVSWSTATPTASSTSVPSGSPTSTLAAPTKRPPSERSVTLASSKSAVVSGTAVLLNGQMTSDNPLCMNAGHALRIEGRPWGQEAFHELAGASTDFNGRFEVSLKIPVNLDLQAVAINDGSCAETSSTPITVLARLSVRASVDDASPGRGDRVKLVGAIRPAHSEPKAILQRKTPSGWARVRSTSVNKRSRFAFQFKAGWRGRRLFRVRCRPADNDHKPGVSKVIRIDVARSAR